MVGQAAPKSRSKKKGGEDVSDDVQAAIQAVDAAAAKLPPEDALNYSVMAADGGGGWNQRASDKPPNPGSKVCLARPPWHCRPRTLRLLEAAVSAWSCMDRNYCLGLTLTASTPGGKGGGLLPSTC